MSIVSFVVKRASLYPVPFHEPFTGVNGTYPNSTFWTRTGDNATEGRIDNNMLNFYYQFFSGSDSATVYFNYDVENDFDISIRLLTTSYTIQSGGAMVRLFTVGLDATHYLQFDMTRGYSGATYHRIRYNLGSGEVVVTPSPTMNDNTYFRVTRVGSNWNAYTGIDENTWTSRLTNLNIGSGVLTNPCSILVYKSNTACNIHWDDFRINQGVIV
jgi:hypothetical protein